MIKKPIINLRLYRGDDQVFLVTLGAITKNEYGRLVLLPQDLSDVKRLDLDIKDVAGNLIGTLSTTTGSILISEATSGQVLLIFSRKITENSTARVAFYDLQAVTEEGQIETKLKGRITIESDVTIIRG